MPPEVVETTIAPSALPQAEGLAVVEDAASGNDVDTKNVAEPDSVAGQPLASVTDVRVYVVVKFNAWLIVVPLT